MQNQSMDAAQSSWYSTYSLVTVERIFGLMQIHLTPDELYTVCHSTNSPYYQILQVPLKNILNGIIMGQATDYREYAQKILVDYLISGAANLDEEQTKPEGARLELEYLRKELIEIGDQFDLLQFEHHKLVGDSQKAFMNAAEQLPRPYVIIDDQLSNHVQSIAAPFFKQSVILQQKFKEFRTTFYQKIIKARELLESLSDYYNNFDNDGTHLESLYFDSKLGDVDD